MSSNDCTYPFLKRAPRILPGLEEFAVELHTPPDTKPKTFWRIGAKSRAREEYSQYLAETERRITDAEGKYISGLLSMSPGVSECIASAESVSPTLWERTPDDSDFMAARLGTGEIPSNVRILMPPLLSAGDASLIRQAEQLRGRHTVLRGVPVCHSFRSYPAAGLSGGRKEVINTACRIVIDIAAHHSYDDVKIMCVYPEHERREWEWVRWLPHVWDSERRERYLACSSEGARKILREASDILTSRSRAFNTKKVPYYLVIIADRSLLEASGEEFLPEDKALGLGVLYAYGELGDLPSGCQSVIICGPSGKIHYSHTKGVTLFTPDILEPGQPDRFSRALAPIRPSGKAELPKYVSFLQGFGVRTVNELNVIDRWKNNRWPKSLAAPIGVRGNGDVFSLDVQVHWRSRTSVGPHGLIAGTAGSGKSEMLISWLLSMAVNYSPEDVNFILLEFGHNDLSNILKQLPHVAGVVSNLDDPSNIDRYLRSLGGEIVRRMKIFKEASEKTSLDTMHILDYQAHQKTHKELPALPYLIVVVDECAQFATQFPDKAGMFTDIARFGNSLGVYMNLTMQAPQGLIKGKVKNSITFNICLRTATAEDSKEIIGTSDAFGLNVPGRAIVKANDSNRIYEEVQTFYANAPYSPGETRKPSAGISFVELDGSRVRAESYRAKQNKPSEAGAVVSYIVGEAQANNISWASPVWTEPLPEIITLDELAPDQRAFRGGVWTERNAGFSVVVGKIDDPENQTQYPLVLDFQKDGHQVVYGAPSSGKTTFIQTALISACLSYTPEQVKFIIIDYGYWGNKFAGLPHCIMSADPEEEAKISEAGEYILNELRRRKELFSRVGAANLKEYTEFTGKSMPKILVVVDGMASLNEHNPGLMNPLIQTAREGGSYGVYLLLSAGTAGSFMYRIYQYVKCNYALQMTDKSDYRALVGGNGTVQPSRRAGRGLKRNSLENDPLNPSDPPQPLEFQTALCVRGGTDRERSLNLRELIASMSASWRGRDPLRVRIGLDKKTSEPAEFVLEEMNGCIISGTDGGGKSSVLGVIAKSLNDDKFTRLYIYEVKKFLEPLCPRAVAVHDAEGADRMLAEIAGEFDSRIGETGERIALCIDDFMTFYRGISEESAKILETLTRDGAARGIYVCIVCDAASLAKLHVFKVKAFMNCLTNENAIIAGGSLGDYPAFSGMWRGTDIHMGEHEGVIVHNKRAVEVVFSKAEGRSEHVPKIFAEPHSLRAIAGALKNYASEGLGNLGGISRLVGILSEAEWSEPALKDYVKTFSVSDETRKAYEDFSQDMHKFADFLNQYARSMDEVEGEKPYSAGWYSSLLRYKNNRLLSAIDGLINGLASDWHGEAQKAFTASYRAKREKFARVSEGLSENLRELQDFLRSHADSLHLTEREQALLSEYIHEDDTH